MKSMFIFTASLFASLVIISSCGSQEKKEPLRSNLSGTLDDSTTIFTNSNLNRGIQDFAQKVALDDSISLFAIFIERKPISARVTVIPIRTIQDTLKFPCPTVIKSWSNKNFLLYNGMELLMPVATLVREKYNTIISTFSNVRGIYDAPVLQYEIFSSDSICQVIPPENPDEKPLDKGVDFIPPQK